MTLVIGDWPVQFLPPTGPLAEDALHQAVETEVEGITTRVFTAEHLAAMALETGRPKDMARLVAFVEEGVLDSLIDSVSCSNGLGWQRSG